MRNPGNDTGGLTNTFEKRTNLSPFVLSLSKGCPSSARQNGQGFDTLGPNGVGFGLASGGAA